MSSAVAAIFNASPRCLRNAMSINDLVDHHCSRFDALRDSSPTSDIFCPDAGCQTVNTIIRQLDRFVFRREDHDGQDRSKGLVTHYCHLVIDIGKHCGFVEEAGRIPTALSAGKYCGATLLRVVHMIGDDLKLAFI